MDSWSGWIDPMTRETVQKPKGPPAAVLGPPSYGFLVSEETFDKVTKRVDFAKKVAEMALRGKRIVGFDDAPYKNMFWQHPYNDADAYAHVGYWTAIAAMGTGNQKLALAAKKYTDAAGRWDTVFLRMKDGGVGLFTETQRPRCTASPIFPLGVLNQGPPASAFVPPSPFIAWLI